MRSHKEGMYKSTCGGKKDAEEDRKTCAIASSYIFFNMLNKNQESEKL